MNINLDIIARKIKKISENLTTDFSEVNENLLLKEAEKKEIENKITKFERENSLSSSIAERLRSSYFQTDLTEDLLAKTNHSNHTTNKYIDMIKKNNEDTIKKLEINRDRESKI